MSVKKVVLAVSLAAGMVAAHANEGPLYGELGYSFLELKVDNLKVNLDQLSAVLGYEISENIAVEGVLGVGMGEKEISDNNGVFAKTKNMYGIYVKPKTKIGDSLSVYGRLGYTSVDFDTVDKNPGGLTGSGTVSGFAYGVGASYAVTKALSVNLDYHVLGKDYKFEGVSYNAELTGYTIGIGYKF